MTETTQKSLRPSRESADSETTAQVAPVTTTKTGTSSARPSFGGARGASSSRGPARGGAGARKGGSPRGGRGGAGFERVKPEFDNKLIQIRRVTRVVAGGRRFAFSVALVAGNRKGSVGVGIGKAGDVQAATEKAIRDAKRHMIVVPLTKLGSIRHDVQAKESSAVVMIKPAAGRGLVAGAAARTVLEHAGVKDVTAKFLSR
ncbi:MAG: 30S ribosomal protein S5, partial [Parcubacteria group bacterium GW2011_GWC1_42_11]